MSFTLCDLFDRTFIGVIHRLPIHEICQLRLISRKMAQKILETRIYQLIFQKSFANSWNSVPTLIPEMFSCKINIKLRDAPSLGDNSQSRLNTKLILNAAFRQDTELVQYASEHETRNLLLDKRNNRFLSRKTLTLVSMILGRPTKTTISQLISELSGTWIRVDHLIQSALATGSELVGIGVLDYIPETWACFIEKVVAMTKTDDYHPNTREVDALFALSLFCIGNRDLKTAQLALDEVQKLDWIKIGESDVKTYDSIFNLSLERLFTKTKCGDPEVVKILQWLKDLWSFRSTFLRDKVDSDHHQSFMFHNEYYCIICSIAFDTGRHDVLTYLDEQIGLKRMLMTHIADPRFPANEPSTLLRHVLKRFCSRSSNTYLSILDRITEVLQDPPRDYYKSSERALLRCLEYLPLASKNGNRICVDWFLSMLPTVEDEDYLWINYFVENGVQESETTHPELSTKIADTWKPLAEKLLECRDQYENFHFSDTSM